MTIKKILLLSTTLIFLLAIGSLFLRFSRKQIRQPNVFLPTPTPVQIPQISPKKINISGVQTNDFLSSPKEVNKNGDVLFAETPKYQLVYLQNFNQFIVSILSSPFETIKKEAEIEFLHRLGITENEACKLNVSVTTPYFANPDYSGKNWPLSFCENKK